MGTGYAIPEFEKFGNCVACPLYYSPLSELARMWIFVLQGIYVIHNDNCRYFAVIGRLSVFFNSAKLLILVVGGIGFEPMAPGV